MMKLREFKFFLFLFLFGINSWSQNYISGYVYEKDTEITLDQVEVYDIDNGLIQQLQTMAFMNLKLLKKRLRWFLLLMGINLLKRQLF